MNTFIVLLLLSITSTTAQAISYDNSEDGKPRNSWERQLEEYRQHNYDSYRNGMALEALERQQREQKRQEEQRREAAERQRNDSYGNRDGVYGGYNSGERCRSVYGC